MIRAPWLFPKMAATVTVVCLLGATVDCTGCMHITVVSLDHAVVEQSASAMAADGVRSMKAKLSPLIVAVAPLLVGALPPTRVCEATEASHVDRLQGTPQVNYFLAKIAPSKEEECQHCARDGCDSHSCLSARCHGGWYRLHAYHSGVTAPRRRDAVYRRFSGCQRWIDGSKAEASECGLSLIHI